MLSQLRTVGSAVERFVDIEEVTGSIPVRSTKVQNPNYNKASSRDLAGFDRQR
jgi:hypothetical protein